MKTHYWIAAVVVVGGAVLIYSRSKTSKKANVDLSGAISTVENIATSFFSGANA